MRFVSATALALLCLQGCDTAGQAGTETSRLAAFDTLISCYIVRSNWSEACKGRVYDLFGIVQTYSDGSGARLMLRQDCSSPDTFEIVLNKGKNLQAFSALTGHCVKVRGRFNNSHQPVPRVELKAIVWTEEREDAFARRTREDAQREQERQEREAERLSVLEANKENPDWLYDEFRFKAEDACILAVEQLANWGYEWTGNFLYRFESYSRHLTEPHILTVHGNNIRFQNGFGAWQDVSYACSYNVRTDSAIAWIR